MLSLISARYDIEKLKFKEQNLLNEICNSLEEIQNGLQNVFFIPAGFFWNVNFELPIEGHQKRKDSQIFCFCFRIYDLNGLFQRIVGNLK